MNQKKPDEIILVHGLWMGPLVMSKLASRLSALGYAVRRFNYPSTAHQLDEHARALGIFTMESEASRVSFISHSMGGLVTLRMLDLVGAPTVGRVALLGTPLSGSEIARRISRVPGGHRLFGKARMPLVDGYTHVPDSTEVGMIAGTLPLGLGVLAGAARQPGDGTVSIREANAPGLTDRIELSVTHTSMLYSARVTDQAVKFIETGHFDHSN